MFLNMYVLSYGIKYNMLVYLFVLVKYLNIIKCCDRSTFLKKKNYNEFYMPEA